jgi:hypothetical protein
MGVRSTPLKEIQFVTLFRLFTSFDAAFAGD